jgi:hypothetical protein
MWFFLKIKQNRFRNAFFCYNSPAVEVVVHKYGGTSIGTPEKIKDVARRVKKVKDEGYDTDVDSVYKY